MSVTVRKIVEPLTHFRLILVQNIHYTVQFNFFLTN